MRLSTRVARVASVPDKSSVSGAPAPFLPPLSCGTLKLFSWPTSDRSNHLPSQTEPHCNSILFFPFGTLSRSRHDRASLSTPWQKTLKPTPPRPTSPLSRSPTIWAAAPPADQCGARSRRGSCASPRTACRGPHTGGSATSGNLTVNAIPEKTWAHYARSQPVPFRIDPDRNSL